MIRIEASEGVSRKGTVIMLHGWAQNAKVMMNKSLTLSRKLKNAGYDVVFLEAPIELPMISTVVVDGQPVQITNGKRPNAKAWFVYNQNDHCDASEAQTGKYINYIGLDQSIDSFRDFLSKSSSEKVALFGFSQGGTFVHLISTLFAADAYTSDDDDDDDTEQDNNNNKKCDDDHETTRFASSWTKNQICCVICAGAFPAKHCPTSNSKYYKYREWFVVDEDYYSSTATKKLRRRKIPSLHVIGKNDTSVVPSKSQDLANLFYDSEIYYHEKGHLISQNSESCQTIIAFLNKHFSNDQP